MEINLHGIDELKEAVEALQRAATQIGMFAKTMTMAAEKMDEALASHIAALSSFNEHQTFLETQRRETESLAQIGRTHGLQNRGTWPAGPGA